MTSKKIPVASHRCVTDSLDDPHLGGILLGLDIKDGLVVANEKIFPCCQGEGSYFDAVSQTVVTCKLKTRIRRAQELVDQYSLIWGASKGAPPFKMNSRASLELLGALDTIIKATSPRAMILTGEKEKAGVLWAYALALAYRFDFDIKILHFKSGVAGALFTGAPPQAIFIEQVDKLYEPELAYELDGIIKFAYEALIPCWIEFISPKPVALADFNPVEQTTVKAQFSHRIGQLKQRSPMTYLTPSALSKLKEMTK